MTIILAAISKMATEMRKISKCSNFSENWYVRFFPHEECDSDKSDLKMASYTYLHRSVYKLVSLVPMTEMD
jgi:hypothetical protein